MTDRATFRVGVARAVHAHARSRTLSFDGTGGSAVDGAVHAFYRVSRADEVAAIKAVIALRKKQGITKPMGPLAPHPLFVKQGNAGAFGDGLEAIIARYCESKNLIRFTRFQSGNLQTTWS